MKINVSIKHNTGILEISSHILGDTDTANLQVQVKELIKKGINRIVLDLTAARLINSIGIGSIMACLTSLNKAGGRLKLSAVSEKIVDLLSLTELDQFFEIHEEAEKAITSFLHES